MTVLYLTDKKRFAHDEERKGEKILFDFELLSLIRTGKQEPLIHASTVSTPHTPA